MEYARSGSPDAERLVDRILSTSRWPATARRRGREHDEADLARLSHALAETRPEQAKQLADRAIVRAQARSDPQAAIEGLLAVVENLSSRQADTAASAIDLTALNVAGSGASSHPSLRDRVARALARFDPAGAHGLLETAGSPSGEAEINRISVYARTDPGEAARRAEDFLEGNSGLLRPLADLATALVGTRDMPGDPILFPIAHRTVRLALADRSWPDALPAIAVLEPAALDAVLAWFDDLPPDFPPITTWSHGYDASRSSLPFKADGHR